MASPIQNNSATEYTDMNPEFLQQHQENRQNFQMDQLIQAVSNIAIQSNLTNQAMLSFFSSQTDRHANRPDSRVRPKSFSGLPSEDILSWLDHFEMVASYHQWPEERKALEMRTLLEGIAATWFIQQPEESKNNWSMLKSLMIGNFAHHDSTQTALQQLETIKQQQHEPVTQFAIRLQQLLTRANPTMPESMKLFFLWPRLRPEIYRRVRDQGPKTFQEAILIAQRIEAATQTELQMSWSSTVNSEKQYNNNATPMEIDIQNAQLQARRNLPTRDAQGRPKCFFCNNYGHVKKHCRKWNNQTQKQNVQVQLADNSYRTDLSEN